MGGLSRGLMFPSSSPALNAISTHPRLRAATAQLLGTSSITLLQSEAWSKSPPAGGTKLLGLVGKVLGTLLQSDAVNPINAYSNSDQRMHMDYPNHYLTHPSPWASPEAVEAILYFDDASECGGATRLVPRQGDDDPLYSWPYVRMPGVAGHDWINDKGSAERYFERADPEIARFRRRLYEREVEVKYRPGTLLLYRFDLWHRGTPLKSTAPPRRVLNLVYAKTGIRHITPWNCRLDFVESNDEQQQQQQQQQAPSAHAIARAAEFGFSRNMYFGGEGELNAMTVQRRSRLGVPPPGDPYWTDAMCDAVRQRFGPRGGWEAYRSSSSECSEYSV